jgi:hypothetical protein
MNDIDMKKKLDDLNESVKKMIEEINNYENHKKLLKNVKEELEYLPKPYSSSPFPGGIQYQLAKGSFDNFSKQLYGKRIRSRSYKRPHKRPHKRSYKKTYKRSWRMSRSRLL